MEQLALVASLCSLPAILFMMVAGFTGNSASKIIGFIFLKIPSFITLTVLVVMALKALKFI
jgi:hypothetical protein